MNKKLIILLILCFLLLNGKSQIFFGSTEINNLFDRLPETYKKIIIQSSLISKNDRVESQLDMDGKIVSYSLNKNILIHIGIKLNGLSVLTKNDSIVKTFLERALLRLSFDKSIPDIVNTAETMQIRIFFQDNNILFSPIFNFNDLLSIINSSESFTITKNNFLLVAQWKNNEKKLSFTFPNNYQLIAGKNKLELDEDLCKNLGGLVSPESPLNMPEEKSSLATDQPILKSEGPAFMNHLSSDTFYALNGSDTILIFERSFISESVTNLFLNKRLTGNRHLNLFNRLYGDRSITLNLRLHEFLEYFEDDFQCFAGMEKSSNEQIEGTVVFSHKYFNYINMLHFKTNSSEIYSITGNIVADFYPNIPMHNVSNLFQENLPENIKEKIEIEYKNP